MYNFCDEFDVWCLHSSHTIINFALEVAESQSNYSSFLQYNQTKSVQRNMMFTVCDIIWYIIICMYSAFFYVQTVLCYIVLHSLKFRFFKTIIVGAKILKLDPYSNTNDDDTTQHKTSLNY